MPITNSEIPVVSEGDTDVGAISFDELLDSGESISSVSSVSEVTSSDLTIANVGKNASSLVIDGRTVTAGRAAQFSVSGQQDDGGEDDAGTYRLRVTIVTDSTPARTLVRDYRFKAV